MQGFASCGPARALIVLASVLLLCLTACSRLEGGIGFGDKGNATRKIGPSEPYYDQSAFHVEGGRYRYDDGEAVAEQTGVDVSDHQGAIDWNSVAADGICFAFIRIGYRGNTEGGLYADALFDTNYMAARDAGIACGTYFYSQATTTEEAQEEASFVLELLADRPLAYPVAFDYEVVPNTRIANVDRRTVTRIGQAFCSAIRAGGYEPMVYGNTFDLARFDDAWLAGCSIWCAEYDDGPSYERRTDVWQYSSQGHVSGIDGFVDLNLDLSDVLVR
jgi:GH25 family lysozyme M1 (1,4-beta-N-acetylmuramidase)